MKKYAFAFLASIALLLFASGCATQHSQYGKKESSLLGGLVETKQGAYDEVGPMSVSLKSSELNRKAKHSGNHVSILWGLIVFADQ